MLGSIEKAVASGPASEKWADADGLSLFLPESDDLILLCISGFILVLGVSGHQFADWHE